MLGSSAIAALFSDLKVVAPAKFAVGQFSGGIGQSTAEDRLGAEPVLLALILEHIFKRVEFFRNVNHFLGDAARSDGVQVRTDVDDNHLLYHPGVLAGEGHTVASAHGVANQDELVQANCRAETF